MKIYQKQDEGHNLTEWKVGRPEIKNLKKWSQYTWNEQIYAIEPQLHYRLSMDS